MSVTRIASRYAKSLLDLAIERGSLETILEDVKGFMAACDNRDFFLLLKSPIVSHDKKAKIFKVLFEGKIDELTFGFINILARKGRENYLPEIAKEFINQYKAFKHISTVKLTTASPINTDQLAKIKAKLSESDATDTNIEIDTEVKEDILGGFILKIEDKLYDASVSHKLAQMRKELQES